MKTLAALLLLPLTTALAQDSGLTLSQALSEASTHSPDAQRADSLAEEAAWRRVETYSGFLPSVNLTGTYLFNKKYALIDVNFGGNPASVPQIVPTANLVLNAQLPLFDGFASTNRWRSARAFESAADHERDWTRFRVERDVTLAFYRALAAKTLRGVAEQNLKTLDDHLKDVRLFRKAGVSTNYDVLRVEVQESEAQSELLNSQDNEVVARNRLAEILGRDSQILALDGELPSLPGDLLKTFDPKDFEDKGDLRAMADRQTGHLRQEQSAGMYWVPKISLFGQYQYYNNRTDHWQDNEAYRDAYQVGLLASWNLFDGMYSFARSKESVQQRIQADLALDVARLKAKQDIDFWQRKYGYYSAVYRARTDDVERSTESVRLAREGRKVGARTNTDLLDAEVDLFRAKANLVNAQLGAIEALIHLELATGQTLYKFR